MMTERDRIMMWHHRSVVRRELISCIVLLALYFLTVGFALWCGYQVYMDR